MRQCKNLAESSNGESNDEEDDGTITCKVCKIPPIVLAEKYGDWVQCDICDEYICPKDISADDEFLCSICIGS